MATNYDPSTPELLCLVVLEKGGIPICKWSGRGEGVLVQHFRSFFTTRHRATFRPSDIPRGGNSWEFLVGVCRTVLQIMTLYFGPKNVIFHTRFETSPLKSVPVFRPGLEEIMPPLLWLEQQNKRFYILRRNMRIRNGNPFRIRIFSFFLTHLELKQ